MYRPGDEIEIQYNKTYKRASFKCTLRTAMCLQLTPNEACMYAFKVGYTNVQAMLRQLNPAYTLVVNSTKYNSSKKYKYNGKQVTEYSITSHFKIACNGVICGELMAEAILANVLGLRINTNMAMDKVYKN